MTGWLVHSSFSQENVVPVANYLYLRVSVTLSIFRYEFLLHNHREHCRNLFKRNQLDFYPHRFK